MSIPMIAGLYPYTRGGHRSAPVVTLREIPESLDVNPGYRERLTVLAGDQWSADQLRGFGLQVHRQFGDAPEWVHRDAAHKMKHWMCRWALEEFGEFLWVDWDTVWIREPLDEFVEWTRSSGTPRFVRIHDYWATVNCGVYYAPEGWATAMEASFEAEVEEPNDELLWRSVLPADVRSRRDFWWGPRVVHVETLSDLDAVSPEAVFVHTKSLSWTEQIRARAGAG